MPYKGADFLLNFLKFWVRYSRRFFTPPIERSKMPHFCEATCETKTPSKHQKCIKGHCACFKYLGSAWALLQTVLQKNRTRQRSLRYFSASLSLDRRLNVDRRRARRGLLPIPPISRWSAHKSPNPLVLRATIVSLQAMRGGVKTSQLARRLLGTAANSEAFVRLSTFEAPKTILYNRNA